MTQIAQPGNNKMRMPIEHYSEEFAKADPKVLSARSGVSYDEATATFRLHMLNRTVEVHWPDMVATFMVDGRSDAITSASVSMSSAPSMTDPQKMSTTDQVRILMGRLLLEGQLVPSTGKMIPYAQVPWGDTYYQAFKRRCIDRLARMFKTGVEFTAAARKLGGISAKDGDASADFEFVDGITIRLSIWEADEEFPASAQFLFSDNISLAFTAEDLAQVGDILLNALQGAARR